MGTSNSQLVIIVVYFSLMFFNSCKKDCTAGSGGEVVLILKPEHHAIPIYGTSTYRDTAFIKFNASDFPGIEPSKYDLVIPGNPGENFVKTPGLKCGLYYIFMTGFDTSAAWNVRVVGGLPIDFSETSGEKTVVIAVSE